MAELKLGRPVLYRLAHLGEEPRAFVRLRPKPSVIKVPVLREPLTAVPARGWEYGLRDMPLLEPTFDVERYSFAQAVAAGIVKAEDYYDEPFGIQPTRPWPHPGAEYYGT